MGVGFGVWGLGFGVWGLGWRVEGYRADVDDVISEREAMQQALADARECPPHKLSAGGARDATQGL